MQFSSHERERLLRKFHAMDTDRSGALSSKEVRKCVENSGLPPGAVDEFMSLFDLDGDGRVTLSEYITALGLNPPPPADVEDWKVAFDSVDQNRSGYLEKDEVRQLVIQFGYSRCSDKEITEWIRKLDTNGDGRISFEEFCTFMEITLGSRDTE
ncbi:hypothetical protein CRM22_006025 [Opisthorchis felineus]|uniref:EF-hand domain-containing protein n=1 Tax=Opisthorchis felineus TaxID=147828 RepID=A0A4S2LVJ6_OPIFE|nr:hypothetical protein CRM22_006025 [Opisthorchis felineus]